jgi:hypothetical protein
MLFSRRVAFAAVMASAILVVVSVGYQSLLQSAETGSYDVQVATYFGYGVWYGSDDPRPVTLVVAVNSSSGPVTQLLGGNFEVKGFWPSEWADDAYYYNPERVGFENLGGGFYRFDVVPMDWQDRQYVFMITASSARGSGVGVGELPLQLQDID